MTDVVRQVDPEGRAPWYGPSMSVRPFLTARLMETWAYGQDVVDAVGTAREPTDRPRHICQIGFITRTWTYTNRRGELPAGDVRLELAAARDWMEKAQAFAGGATDGPPPGGRA